MGRLLFWRNEEKGGYLGHEGRPAGDGLVFMCRLAEALKAEKEGERIRR